jgi:hypothetical protein
MHKGAKIVGLLVFVVGVVMLGAVFFAALDMLHQSRATEITDIAKQLPREGFVLLARILFLFLLGYIASAVAARGIQLYEAGPRDAGLVTPADPPQAPQPAPPADTSSRAVIPPPHAAE